MPDEGFAARALELGRQNAARPVPHHRSLLLHWLGRLARRPQRAAAHPLPPVDRGQLAVTYIGHASVLLRYKNLSIACDPMLGSFAGPVRRAVSPGLSAAELGDVDLVLISHGGADHLHLPTLARLPRAATVVVPSGTGHRVSKLGFARLVELGVGQSIEHRRVDVAATAVRREGVSEPGLAYVIRGDGPSVFFCGDSGYFSGFADVGRRFRPDLALLPIGGYWPPSFRDRHLSPIDALFAFEDLKARLFIPIRHGTFALSYEALHDAGRWLAELVSERRLEAFVLPLEAGESRVFVPPRQRTPRPSAPATAPFALGEPGGPPPTAAARAATVAPERLEEC